MRSTILQFYNKNTRFNSNRTTDLLIGSNMDVDVYFLWMNQWRAGGAIAKVLCLNFII